MVLTDASALGANMVRRNRARQLSLPFFFLITFCGAPRASLRGATEALPSFVTEEVEPYVTGPRGIGRIRLDGTGDRVIFPPGHFIRDVTADGTFMALSDDDTNLRVGDTRQGTLRAVSQLAKRVSEAAFSPDGKTLAATRHADFDLPQSRQVEDDTVYLIDVETLAARELPAATDHWPVRLGWSTAGDALYLRMQEGPSQVVKVADGTRTELSQSEAPFPLRQNLLWGDHLTCATSGVKAVAVGFDEGIDLVAVDGSSRRIVTIDNGGRRAGCGDQFQALSLLYLTPHCSAVVFSFGRVLYVASVDDGRLGRLGDWTGSLLPP